MHDLLPLPASSLGRKVTPCHNALFSESNGCIHSVREGVILSEISLFSFILVNIQCSMDGVGVGHAFCDFGNPVVVPPTVQLCDKMAHSPSRFMLRYEYTFISLPLLGTAGHGMTSATNLLEPM